MYKFSLCGMMLLAALGCKEKPKEPSLVDEIKSEIEEVIETQREAEKKNVSLSVEERAAKLGFAKHLPADTEMLISVYQAKQAADQFQALKVFGLLQGGMSVSGGGEFEDEELELEFEQAEEGDFAGEIPEGEMAAEGPNVWTLLGQEVTFAMGESSGEQLGHMLQINQRMAFFQAEAFGLAAQALAKDGTLESFREAMRVNSEGKLMVKLLNDPESGVPLIEKAVFPPMYLAFRAKDGELEQAAQMIASSMGFFGMAGEMAAPIEVETGGSKFVGYKLLGEKFSQLLLADREKLEKELKPETIDAFVAALSKKNLIFVTGTVGDYVVLMIGGDEASLKLVDKPKESMAGSKKMNFVDEFGEKSLLSVSYGDQASLETIVEKAGGLATYALGFRQGIAAADGLGETRDIEEMLQLMADREKALQALGSTDTFGMVAYVEDGLKVDSFGGHDKGSVDWARPTSLAHLGDDPQNFLFLNAPSHAAYDESLSDYMEVIVEMTYALAMKFSALDLEPSEMGDVKDFVKFFDADSRDDLLGVYQAVAGDFVDGLGQESAVVIDLKGAMPAMANVPQAMVDEGKVPRLSIVAPVEDRAKLSKAWDQINEHSTSLMAKVSEMTETKIPMQKPISSEKDGMITWFISMPFFQDDFLPSVTVSDDWFAASSSKVQALDLMGKAALGGEKGDGVKFRVNFNLLSDYADEMLKALDKNAEQIFKDEDDRAEFQAEKSTYLKWIEASREFDVLKWDIRKEGDLVRSRVHIKTH